jgi:hypothetical protein
MEKAGKVKKKVALLLGYSGTNYHGIQEQLSSPELPSKYYIYHDFVIKLFE